MSQENVKVINAKILERRSKVGGAEESTDLEQFLVVPSDPGGGERACQSERQGVSLSMVVDEPVTIPCWEPATLLKGNAKMGDSQASDI